MIYQRFAKTYNKLGIGALLVPNLFIIVAIIFNAHILLAKLPNPITGSFTPTEILAKVGDEVTVTLEFETVLAFPEVELSVKIPKGVTVVSGVAQVKITDFKVGEKKKYEYKFKIDEKGEKQILGSVKTIGLVNETYGQVFILMINKEVKKDPSFIKTDKEGNKYIIRSIPTKKEISK